MTPAARYVQTKIVREGARAVWSVVFNFAMGQAYCDLFASISGHQATVYRCYPSGGISAIQAYRDANVDEEYFAVKWTSYSEKHSTSAVLLLGGLCSVLRVVNISTGALAWTAVGHGGPINDIAVHILRPHIVITASRDQSLRVWNIVTRCCIAIVNGECGHRNEILSVDFNATDCNRFVSSGMDTAIKIWNLEDVIDTVAASSEWDEHSQAHAFRTAFLTQPDFSTQTVHHGYVDCVRWLGDYIMSKSVDGRILVWQPVEDSKTGGGFHGTRPRFSTLGHIDTIQELRLDGVHNLWFVRFSLDRGCRLVACGGATGHIDLFECDQVSRKPKYVIKTTHDCKSTVRQTALSWDANTLLAACDDGCIRRYDLQ